MVRSDKVFIIWPQYFLESQLKVKHFLAQIFELEPHSDFADYLFIQILGVSPYLLLYI